MKDVISCDKPRGAAHKRLIRGFPNGKTQQVEDLLPLAEYIGYEELTRRTETSKYPEEEKTIVIS